MAYQSLWDLATLAPFSATSVSSDTALARGPCSRLWPCVVLVCSELRVKTSKPGKPPSLTVINFLPWPTPLQNPPLAGKEALPAGVWFPLVLEVVSPAGRALYWLGKGQGSLFTFPRSLLSYHLSDNGGLEWGWMGGHRVVCQLNKKTGTVGEDCAVYGGLICG